MQKMRTNLSKVDVSLMSARIDGQKATNNSSIQYGSLGNVMQNEQDKYAPSQQTSIFGNSDQLLSVPNPYQPLHLGRNNNSNSN
jgi:hypothetical protein